SGVALVLIGTGLIGGLVAVVVAPATAVIMNELGEAKAGDGGAINQLARQVGGALGVAIIGTVFAAVYTDQIDAKLARLTAARRGRAPERVGGARDGVDRGAAGRGAGGRPPAARVRADSVRRRLRPGRPGRLRCLRRRA